MGTHQRYHFSLMGAVFCHMYMKKMEGFMKIRIFKLNIRADAAKVFDAVMKG